MAKQSKALGEPPKPTDTNAQRTREERVPAGGKGKDVALGARVPEDVRRRYKVLAVSCDCSVRDLLIEALDMLEVKHGKA